MPDLYDDWEARAKKAANFREAARTTTQKTNRRSSSCVDIRKKKNGRSGERMR
jgi:hypothetical protein